MRRLVIALSTVRVVPHLAFFLMGPCRDTIRADLARWESSVADQRCSTPAVAWAFAEVMTFTPEFRNLFYYRIRSFSRVWSKLLKLTCRPMPTLFIRAEEIGPGLFIQHGYATGMTAKSIGRDCWINQHVTLGFVDDTRGPILGDRVRIGVGARVLGPITVGDDSIVGANAVVVKSVPPRCVVVGVPARIVRRDGRRVHEAL